MCVLFVSECEKSLGEEGGGDFFLLTGRKPFVNGSVFKIAEGRM